MKQLVLIRHAKSSWDDPDLEDFDRPLSERGRLAAPVTGAWLTEKGLSPDYVALSPARRSVETWERISRQLDTAIEPNLERSLYMASPDTMLAVLHRVPKEANTVFMIGHQPGMSNFALRITNNSVSADCSRAFTKFPTAAVAVIAFDTKDWSKAGYGKGAFRSFATPKELV